VELSDFFDKLWFGYPNDLCHGKKGSKFRAQKMCEKLDPDQFKKILMNMEALIRFDRGDSKPDRWPHVSTFINQGYYDREIPSVAEQKLKIEAEKCQCGQDVIGPKYDTCEVCFYRKNDQWMNRRVAALKKMDILQEGMSYQQVIDRCKDVGTENGRFSLTKLFKDVRK
jgi:hypothetical protein